VSSAHILEVVEPFGRSLASGASVLDVGCGMRPYEQCFAHCEYIGIDVESSGREGDYKRADRYYDGINIPFDAERFDAILCNEVFEHCEDPDALANDMWRVLVPGGHLLMTVPLMWGEHELPFDFRRYTRNGITRQLEGAGFTVTSVDRLLRGVDAVEMLVHSELGNFDNNVAPEAIRRTWPARRRFARWLAQRVWRLQLRLWRASVEFDRIYIDNAVLAVKNPAK
jgi:SAM-dependent methyltransferase